MVDKGNTVVIVVPYSACPLCVLYHVLKCVRTCVCMCVHVCMHVQGVCMSIHVCVCVCVCARMGRPATDCKIVVRLWESGI